MLLELKRFSFTKHGTFGVLGYVSPDGLMPLCFTLEDPWLDNQANISCIPPGHYNCHRIDSPKFGEVYEIENVVGRTKILIHRGNTIHDTHGCVLLGASIEQYPWGISRSGEAYGTFWALVNPLNDFVLTIRNPTP